MGPCDVDADCTDDQDEEVCTENDVCALGVCQGSLFDCSDDDPLVWRRRRH